MAEIELSKEEWEAAMNVVLSAEDAETQPEKARSVVVKRVAKGSKMRVVPTKDALVLEIPSDGGFATRVGRPQAKGPSMTEIPNNHPAGCGHSITPADPQQNDTDDNANIQDEIPAGGGFTSRNGRPTGKVSTSKEIPNNHPPAASRPRTPIDWAAVAEAAKAAINYGTDTSKGWSTGRALPKVTEPWGNNFPQGSHQDLPDDGKTVTDTTNKSVRTSLASEEAAAGTAGEHVQGPADAVRHDHCSLPDGSFTIHTPDDVANAVAKVKNADQNNPRQDTHPWYSDIKRHIVRRADALGANHLIPADWQLMVAHLEDADVGAEERRDLAKKGHALPDGSYPIRNTSDLHSAIVLARSGHGNVAEAKALIKRRAKDLGAESMLPDEWQ